MRMLSLVLLALILATGTAPAATAKDRGGGARAKPAAASAATQPAHRLAAAKPRRGKATAVASRHGARMAGRHAGMRQDGRTAAASHCLRVRGKLQCRPQTVGWMHGLPPAAGIQAAGCPAGTMSTLAAGHDDVVRCMPL